MRRSRGPGYGDQKILVRLKVESNPIRRASSEMNNRVTGVETSDDSVCGVELEYATHIERKGRQTIRLDANRSGWTDQEGVEFTLAETNNAGSGFGKDSPLLKPLAILRACYDLTHGAAVLTNDTLDRKEIAGSFERKTATEIESETRAHAGF